MVQLPAGAVTETVTLVYIAGSSHNPETANGNFIVAGSAFTLSAYRDGMELAFYEFQIPVTVTLWYTSGEVAGLDESKLQAFYFSSATSTWETTGIQIIRRDLEGNLITFTITHLTRFGLFAPRARQVFLPLVRQ